MRFLLLPLVVAGMAASATIDAREDLRMARLDDLAYRVEDLERLADLDPNGRVKWSILCTHVLSFENVKPCSSSSSGIWSRATSS